MDMLDSIGIIHLGVSSLQVNLFMRPLICSPVSPKSMAICGRCWNSMTWNFREKSHGILVVNLVGN